MNLNIKHLLDRYLVYKWNPMYNYDKELNLKHKYILKGGGIKEFTITLNEMKEKDYNPIFTFYRVYDDKKNQVILLSKIDSSNNLSKDDSCVVITLNKNVAHLDKIQNEDFFYCVNLVDFNLKNPGSFHLELAIKMLKKYKDKFKIDRIELLDNAVVQCNNDRIHLSTLQLLTKGYTFYGKYGFEFKNKTFKKLEHDYLKYTSNLKVKDVDWDEIFRNARKSIKQNFYFVSIEIYIYIYLINIIKKYQKIQKKHLKNL
mgnify:CR=1 FL=1